MTINYPPWINNKLVSEYHAGHAEIRTILIQKGDLHDSKSLFWNIHTESNSKNEFQSGVFCCVSNTIHLNRRRRSNRFMITTGFRRYCHMSNLRVTLEMKTFMVSVCSLYLRPVPVSTIATSRKRVSQGGVRVRRKLHLWKDRVHPVGSQRL